jgi:triacylglycerol lipase
MLGETSVSMPRLSAPIVLVHGLFGYDHLRLGSWTVISYFVDIPEALQAAGNRVLIPRLRPTAGIADRAAELKAFLDREAPGDAVHVIAHSMGGLDSRYMISKLGMAERVLSLTTLGTPHRGSPFADWGCRRIEFLVGPVLDSLGISRQAFYDLTTASCQTFNAEVPNAASVRYFSVAGRFTADWTTPAWQLPWRVVHEKEGANDGLVSVASATWGEHCEVWDGHHASLVNRALPLSPLKTRWPDRIPQYEQLVQRLAEVDVG